MDVYNLQGINRDRTQRISKTKKREIVRRKERSKRKKAFVIEKERAKEKRKS